MLMNDGAKLNPAAATPRIALAPGALLLIALALLAPLALYWSTGASIVSVWNSSETFAHGYVIAPISAWLIWRKRANFLLYPPRPYWPALVLRFGAGLAWLAGRVGGVQFVMQYAFVAMFPIIALAVLGKRLAASLAFPLLFLLFAVPFGEVFIPRLIEFTADFTVWALRATGIPVLRNGTRFDIPTGSWSVVTACSGVRYLISSITIGCLFAYLSYRSMSRRLLFIALSVVVPVIANGLRAYMIVMIGHTSNMALATGVDHLIYGWLFFGLVMFVMFWIGSYWRDDTEPVTTAAAAQHVSSQELAGTGARLRAVVPAALLIAAVWPLCAGVIDKASHNPRPVQLGAVPVSWSAAPAFTSWTPEYMTPDATSNAVYRAPDSGTPVALTLLYYRNQDTRKSLISSTNVLAGEKEDFHQNGSSARVETVAGQRLALVESLMQGRTGNFLVWHWMQVDGQYTSTPYIGKLWQARARFALRGDDGAAIMVSAPYGDDPEAARAALRAFLNTQLGAIGATLAQTRSR
jgi:exosortase A